MWYYLKSSEYFISWCKFPTVFWYRQLGGLFLGLALLHQKGGGDWDNRREACCGGRCQRILRLPCWGMPIGSLYCSCQEPCYGTALAPPDWWFLQRPPCQPTSNADRIPSAATWRQMGSRRLWVSGSKSVPRWSGRPHVAPPSSSFSTLAVLMKAAAGGWVGLPLRARGRRRCRAQLVPWCALLDWLFKKFTALNDFYLVESTSVATLVLCRQDRNPWFKLFGGSLMIASFIVALYINCISSEYFWPLVRLRGRMCLQQDAGRELLQK